MDDKMIVVVFDNEKKAYEGSKALKDLHAEGSITLYASAVIAKDADGKVTVKQAADQGPLGTAVGLVTGSLIGLLGGPALGGFLFERLRFPLLALFWSAAVLAATAWLTAFRSSSTARRSPA